jgi:hypothetical protein
MQTTRRYIRQFISRLQGAIYVSLHADYKALYTSVYMQTTRRYIRQFTCRLQGAIYGSLHVGYKALYTAVYMQATRRYIRQFTCRLQGALYTSVYMQTTRRHIHQFICRLQGALYTSVYMQTTRRYIPKDSHIHNYSCENLKFYTRLQMMCKRTDSRIQSFVLSDFKQARQSIITPKQTTSEFQFL